MKVESPAVARTRAPAPLLRRARHGVFVAWTGTLGLVLWVGFIALTALTVSVWLVDPAAPETNPAVDSAFFALGAVLTGTGFAAQVRKPERHVAGVQQAVVALLALAAAGFLGGRIEPMWGGLFLLLAAMPAVMLHPARGEVLRVRMPRHRPLVVLSLAAVAPAAVYAGAMLGLAADAGPSCFLGQCARGDRFAEAAALAVGVVAAALLGSTDTPGWRLAARSAGAAALVVGLTSIAVPGVDGSLGVAWGGAAVLWGLLVIVAGERRTAETAPEPISGCRGRGRSA